MLRQPFAATHIHTQHTAHSANDLLFKRSNRMTDCLVSEHMFLVFTHRAIRRDWYSIERRVRRSIDQPTVQPIRMFTLVR